MKSEVFNIAPKILAGALTVAVGLGFGGTSAQAIRTTSPVSQEKYPFKNFNSYDTESPSINDWLNLSNPARQLGTLNTPVFEPDIMKSASKSRSLNTLNDISKLEEDWNGYSAKPIPPETISLCRKIVMLLNYQPEIYPTGRRSVQMEYEKADRSYLEFEISQDKIKVMEVPKRQYKNAKKSEIPASNYESLSEIVNEFCGGFGEWEISTISESYIA